MSRPAVRWMAAMVLGVVAQSWAAPKARIAVVFEEQVRGVFGMSGAWTDPGRAEETLVAELRNAGYEVVDPQTVRANVLREQAIQVLSGDQKAAVAAGSRLQAPYVVVGKGYAKSAGQVVGSSMKSLQAQVQLTLVDTGSGEVLASATGSAARPHIDEVVGGGEALAEATAQASRKLVDEIQKDRLSATGEGRFGEGSLKVSISGLRSYRHFLHIKEWIQKNAPGFRELANENYTAGNAELDVRCVARGHDFAAKIATAEFEGFTVNPIDVSDRSVVLKVIIHE